MHYNNPDDASYLWLCLSMFFAVLPTSSIKILHKCFIVLGLQMLLLEHKPRAEVKEVGREAQQVQVNVCTSKEGWAPSSLPHESVYLADYFLEMGISRPPLNSMRTMG